MNSKTSPYALLKNKNILAILDGDTPMGTYLFSDGQTIEVRMPYLSGPNLCDISNQFGLPVSYNRDATLSRWQYLDNLMDYCIEQDKFSALLSYLFDKAQFADALFGYNVAEIDAAYTYITSRAIQMINGILYFGGNELSLIGKQFIVHPIGSHPEVETPKIKAIDREYIKDISSRAMDDVEQNNFDSAITKSRTLLEETFCYVIEKKGAAPSDNGDMMKLFKQVRELYNMHTDKDTDRRINTLLSGLNSIVSAISEMRNKDSDAHGVGSKRIPIRGYHARLFVNSAMTLADFILAVENNANTAHG